MRTISPSMLGCMDWWLAALPRQSSTLQCRVYQLSPTTCPCLGRTHWLPQRGCTNRYTVVAAFCTSLSWHGSTSWCNRAFPRPCSCRHICTSSVHHFWTSCCNGRSAFPASSWCAGAALSGPSLHGISVGSYCTSWPHCKRNSCCLRMRKNCWSCDIPICICLCTRSGWESSPSIFFLNKPHTDENTIDRPPSSIRTWSRLRHMAHNKATYTDNSGWRSRSWCCWK